MWRGRHVVLGVTGGIAAYKSVHLARQLTMRGARVDVVLSRGAGEFIGAVTFEAVTRRPVRRSLWEPDTALDHVTLGEQADLIIVAPATALYRSPMHPYTVGLLASRPLVGQGGGGRPRRRLPAIRGMVPDLGSLPAGCDFAPRCPDVFDDCHAADPPLFVVGAGHMAACEKYRPAGGRGERPDPFVPPIETPRASV